MPWLYDIDAASDNEETFGRLRCYRPLRLAGFRRRRRGADRGPRQPAVVDRRRWSRPGLGGPQHVPGDAGEAQSFGVDGRRRAFDGRTPRRTRRGAVRQETTCLRAFGRCQHQRRRRHSSRLVRPTHARNGGRRRGGTESSSTVNVAGLRDQCSCLHSRLSQIVATLLDY